MLAIFSLSLSRTHTHTHTHAAISAAQAKARSKNSRYGGFEDHILEDNAPLCAEHQQGTKLVKVKKAGPNKVRTFWTRDFYLWHFVANVWKIFSIFYSEIKCAIYLSHSVKGLTFNVYLSCKLFIAKGRKFYSCRMDQDQKCNFFMWAEVSENHGNECRLTCISVIPWIMGHDLLEEKYYKKGKKIAWTQR